MSRYHTQNISDLDQSICSLCCGKCRSSQLRHKRTPHNYRSQCVCSPINKALSSNQGPFSFSFTDFATFLLHNEDFTWTISTPALRLTALGNIFENVALSKDVSFKAFNGLPGVTISNFQLPSDSPQGGIVISTDSSIPSPAQREVFSMIQQRILTFSSRHWPWNCYVRVIIRWCRSWTWVDNEHWTSLRLTPHLALSGSNLFLAPQTTTKLHLDGRIKPQSGDALNTIGTLFSNVRTLIINWPHLKL